MAKRTTFVAVDPIGNTHTRTSESRVYSHTVVRPPSVRLEKLRARRAQPDARLEWLDPAIAELEANPTYSNLGWCSRLDLAQRLAEPGDVILPATVKGA
jgi:type IV pilus biogenesis protein CpaD/CtpE